MFSLTLATLAARWGAVGVAAQSIGAQIEAISWMTAAGFLPPWLPLPDRITAPEIMNVSVKVIA